MGGKVVQTVGGEWGRGEGGGAYKREREGGREKGRCVRGMEREREREKGKGVAQMSGDVVGWVGVGMWGQ